MPLMSPEPFLISVVCWQPFKKPDFLTGLEIKIMVSFFHCVTASGQGTGKESMIFRQQTYLA